MFSSALAAALAWRQVHYGWVVVGTTFLTMLIVAGAVGAPGVLLLPLQREFGWATSDISVAMALRLLLFGLPSLRRCSTGLGSAAFPSPRLG
jgi:hypothetical protein